MGDPHVITALVRKHAELAGELVKLDRQRRTAKARIAHVDEAFRLFGYHGNPNDILPRARYSRLFKRGELRRMVSDLLRSTNRHMTNREIAVQIVQKRGWSGENAELLERVMGSVKPTRRLIEKR